MVKTVLLLTGKPSTGKTALIKEILSRAILNQVQDKAGGFYTEEIRIGGVRQGFRIITLGGDEAILAHVSISSRYQVSKYLDIVTFEKIVKITYPPERIKC